MIGSWWSVWMAFMFMLLILPLGYGWGYRGWGPPYPRYIQRRRGQRAAVIGSPATFNHHSWSWGGDFVWMVLVIGVFWAAWALLSRSA
jgi:hypothetical protein